MANVPGGGVPTQGQPGQPGAVAPGQSTLQNVPDQPVFDTNHPKPAGSGGGGSLLSKLKPNKSQDKVTTSQTPAPGGPPIVRPSTPADGANGKQTRFSDTAHAVPADESSVIHNVPQDGGGGGPNIVSTPGGSGSQSPGIAVVDDHNKLRKGKPVVHQDGKPAPPGMGGPGTVIATPGSGGPSGTPAPAVDQSTPAPAGTPATTTKITPPRPSSAAGAPVISTTTGADAIVPETLEEVVLPDGRTAYIRPTPVAGGGKKGKQTEDITSKTKITGAGPGMATMATGPAESQQGHCSVCCPTAARTQQGVPIQPCAHQDGPLGTAVPGSINSKTNNKTKLPAPGGAPPAGMLNLPGETGSNAAVADESITGVDASNKLKKPVKGGPPGAPGAAGPSGLSPQEKAMEDARSLASKYLHFKRDWP